MSFYHLCFGISFTLNHIVKLPAYGAVGTLGADSTPFDHTMALDLWWALDHFSGPNPRSVTAVKLPHVPGSQRKQTWVQKNL